MSLNNLIGGVYVPAGAKEFASGDRVKCDLDMEVLSIATAVGEGANDQISMVRSKVNSRDTPHNMYV